MKGWQRQQHLQQQWQQQLRQQQLRQQQLCSNFVRATAVTATSTTTTTTAATSQATAVMFPFCENNDKGAIKSSPMSWKSVIWSKKTTTEDDSQLFFEWQQMAGKTENWWANHYYRPSGNLIFVARAPPPSFLVFSTISTLVVFCRIWESLKDWVNKEYWTERTIKLIPQWRHCPLQSKVATKTVHSCSFCERKTYNKRSFWFAFGCDPRLFGFC